jgi:hypothetical protein
MHAVRSFSIARIVLVVNQRRRRKIHSPPASFLAAPREWAEDRILMTQFRNMKGNGLE